MSRGLPLLKVVVSLLIAVISIVYYDYGLFTSKRWLGPSRGPHTLASPPSSSWNSWAQALGFIPGLSGNTRIQNDDWNLLYHLGGNGPWIEKLDGPDDSQISGSDLDGCVIDQVHMRFDATQGHLALLDRIHRANVKLNGTLSFLNNWTYFTDDPSRDFEQLTTTGPYAGTTQSYSTGKQFAARYEALASNQVCTNLWASDCTRVIQTARHFAAGMSGSSWDASRKAALEIIPETSDRGADTLTPGDTCLRYIDDTEHGHDYGIKMLARFQQAYIPAIAARLIEAEGNQALGAFSNAEVYSMQEMCGFETLVRGSSPWCEVFGRDDWENFEYARDLLHYYRAGPGNPYAGAMGWLWLDATTSLLRAGPGAGTLFFSFVHDGDIAPFLTALDVMKDPKYDPALPVTHVARDRVWRTSSVMPMGGRIVLERMTCLSEVAGADGTAESYLRVSINDKVAPLPYCKSGPGLSCPLVDFIGHVDRKRLDVGDFGAVCGLEGDPGKITFLRQEQRDV